MTKLPMGCAALALLLTAAACTPTEQSAALGALGGAVVGAAVSSDEDRGKGIVTGAAIGTAAGILIGQSNTPGQCIYEDAYGQRYRAPC